MKSRVHSSQILAAFCVVELMCSSALAQGFSASEAASRMTVPDGLEVRVVASEPMVRQPVAMEFDDQGRLWVIQYLQYPNPEGLKRVEVDRYSRTRYDRIPEPPPRGPVGADRITILSDTNQDGTMDSAKDFVSGLNLTSGFALGHDGIFVLNAPYLLFYPDRDRDDRPDSDPEVLLTGFGMEDAHSVANSLTFGPDGWLYGCQGSTVTAKVRDIEFQQGVWRYHPVTREFELFCEGGGNCWGLDFDAVGRLLYSTNYGGYVCIHGLQGAYYVKSFGKHGALHNPHAYGYFEHTAHAGFQGGHVTVGGLICRSPLFPELQGRFIGGDLLGHAVHWHTIHESGSSIRTAHGGTLVQSNDPWFAPTDLTFGPDGALYVSDWHDARTAHPDPDAEWDRSNGRIYRIAPRGTPAFKPLDLRTRTLTELTDDILSGNELNARYAQKELVRRTFHTEQNPEARRDLQQIVARLTTTLESESPDTSLHALWTLASMDQVSEKLAVRLLDSRHEFVRVWSVRLLGDRHVISQDTAHRLDELAETDSSISVRQQLACSARRWPAAQAMPVINAHINRNTDTEDPWMPLLWWWAVEQHAVSGRDEVMARFVRPSLWKSRLGSQILLPRLVRRYTAEGTPEGLNCVERLLQSAPGTQERHALWDAVLSGWTQRPHDSSLPQPTSELRRLLKTDVAASPDAISTVQLGILWNEPPIVQIGIQTAFQRDQQDSTRITLLQTLARSGSVRDLTSAAMMAVTSETEPAAVRIAALEFMAADDRSTTAQPLLQLHDSIQDESVRSAIRNILLRRPEWTRALLNAVQEGQVSAAAIPIAQVQLVAIHKDPELDEFVRRHWGKVNATTPEQKLAEVRRLNNDLRAAPGNPEQGQVLFRKHCSACHTLFQEGNRIGPDLTTANRADRDFLLVSLVDPGFVVRREYVSVTLQLTNGQVVTGFPIMRDDQKLTLMNSKAEKTDVFLSEIEETADSPVSLMPEGLYRQFSPQELRDLFAWLQLPNPPVK